MPSARTSKKSDVVKEVSTIPVAATTVVAADLPNATAAPPSPVDSTSSPVKLPTTAVVPTTTPVASPSTSSIPAENPVSATSTSVAPPANPLSPTSIRVAPVNAPTVATATPAVTLSMPNVADPLPTVTIPSVPASFAPPELEEFRGHYPNKGELAAIPGAVSDLGRFVSYAALLGTSVTSAADVAATLNLALQWRGVRDSSNSWDTYVKVQDAIAWKAAMAMLDDVKPLFAFAVAKSPSLATQYPWLAKLLGAQKVIASKASATKAKKAKAADAAAASSNKAAATAVASAAKAAANTVTSNAAAAATASAAKTASAAAAATAGADQTVVPAAVPTTAAKAVTTGA